LFTYDSSVAVQYARATSLEIAASYGHTDVVKMLIKAGADVNYQNKQVMSLSSVLAGQFLAQLRSFSFRYTEMILDISAA
jgi:ankyrin repeat protein